MSRSGVRFSSRAPLLPQPEPQRGGVWHAAGIEDLVAVRVNLADGSGRFILTFGRIQDTVDPGPLEAIVLRHCGKFGLRDAVSAEVCWSLQDASQQTYFHEGVSQITAKRAVAILTEDYFDWRNRIRDEMETGRHLYYCGDPHPPAETTPSR